MWGEVFRCQRIYQLIKEDEFVLFSSRCETFPPCVRQKRLNFCKFGCTINNIKDMSERFLGWNSTKQRIKCHGKGHHTLAVVSLKSHTLPLSNCLPLDGVLNHFITQPSIYGVIGYFLLCHESLNYWPVSILTIAWHYTIAWFPASLFKHTCAYRHARQRCAYGSFMKGDVVHQR